MEKNDKPIRALCLSGGGSKGAFTGGMLEYMKLVEGRDYDMYLGTSTGALLQTLTSSNDFLRLREAYTTMSIDDIYTISPFKKNSTHEDAKINWWSVFKMVFFKKEPTFGDSGKLRDLIREFFPKYKYLEAIDNGKVIVPCVTNLSKVRTEFYANTELGADGYDEFCDWTWISANAVPFTSLVEMNGDYYADGGFMEHMPIQEAINRGATEIDCITTKPECWDGDGNVAFGNNPLKLLERMIDAMMWETSKRDIDAALYSAKDKAVTINIYYAPRTLTENSMFFDKDIMNEWWDEGYDYMKSFCENKMKCKTIKLRAKRKSNK